ncbi:MAG: hypothetical protein K2O54_06215, partial [Prevotella sp.]|nr:hypothetical protein [Prevotella sp.]
MKKWMILSMLFVALPATMMAQDDDMYFASSKSKTTQQRPYSNGSGNTYYSGSSRSIDDYNRRLTSSYEVLPTDTGDIISFTPVEGVYPDSVGDFQLTRQMQRWDDYVPSTAYWEGYAQGQRDSYGWHSPWFYSSYYPWYDSWYYNPWYYDPWYYDYWYRPWHYSYHWGWHYPHYGWHGGWGYHGSGYAYRPNGTIDRYGRTGGRLIGNRNSNNSNSPNASTSRGISVRSKSRTAGTNRNTVRPNGTTSNGNFSGN